jgi:hypothetical protein
MPRARLAAIASVSFAAAAVAMLTPTASYAAATSATPVVVGLGDQATFRISCSGSPNAANLTGTALDMPSDVTMEMTSRGHFALTLRIPPTVRPGTYDVDMACANGDIGSARIDVSSHGGTRTGDSTGAGAGLTTTVVGGGAVALAAVFGAILLGKRQNLDSSD